MGCANIVPRRRSSKISIGTIESLDSNEARYARIKQRDGLPSVYKNDGYDIGLRIKIRGNMQTYYVGTAKQDGQKVTIKEYHVANCQESHIVDELVILSQLSHESLPKLREIFVTNASIYAVTDFIDSMKLGSFVSVKNKATLLSINDTRKIFKSIVSATSFCHDNKIIIRNITLNNIMVKKSITTPGDFEVKIIDFSQAVEYGSLKVLYDRPLFDWAEVPYCAPEALLGHPYSYSMDVWSIGVLLFAMLSGELPFDSENDKELVDKIKFAYFDFKQDNKLWNYVDIQIKDFIEQIIVAKASDRPTCKSMLKTMDMIWPTTTTNTNSQQHNNDDNNIKQQ